MASSTTMPIANTKANNVRIFRLKSVATRQAKVPISDTMMEMDGITVLFKSCRKRYTTMMTRMIAMTSVSTTLWMEAKRKSLVLISCWNCKPLGKF